MPPKRAGVAVDDTGDLRLQCAVERCPDRGRAILTRGSEHHLDEVRRSEWGGRWRERQRFVTRFTRLWGSQRTRGLHTFEHGPLARHREVEASPRVEPRRTLRQAREKRGLCRRQHGCRRAEVRLARAFDAGDLIPIPREVQVDRENLPLGEAMLEPERDDGFADLGGPSALSFRLSAVQKQFCGLL